MVALLKRLPHAEPDEWINMFRMAFSLGKMCVYPLAQAADTANDPNADIGTVWLSRQLLHSMKHCAGITRLSAVNTKQKLSARDLSGVFSLFHCFDGDYLGHNLSENCDHVNYPRLRDFRNTPDMPTRILIENLLEAVSYQCGSPPVNSFTDAFRRLDNHFIGRILNNDDIYGIPLTRAVIFCCYAADYGLEAYPLLFPSEVLVRVNEKGTSARFFVVDVFRRNRIMTHDQVLGLVPVGEDLGSPDIKDIFIRSMVNLQASLEVNARRGLASPTESYYLMYTLMKAFMPAHMDRDRQTQLQEFLRKFFPLDVLLMLKDINRVFLTKDSPEVTSLNQLDPVLRAIKNRNATTTHVRYRVGHIVHHTRLRLFGVVVSWYVNSESAYEETAQVPNRENDVGMEESEAYYHVVVDGVGEKRVFAESNLDLVSSHSMMEGETVTEKFADLHGLCLMFTGFDEEHFRFEPTKIIKKCYPDD